VLVGEVAMVAEAIIRKTCKKWGIEIIDMSVSPDHIHLFIQYPPKYSVSFIAKRLKEEVVEYCDRNSLNSRSGVRKVSGHQVAIMEVLDMAGKLLRNISPDKIGNRKAKAYYRPCDLSIVT
jgi:REP element-mobilizing transposase RayT